MAPCLIYFLKCLPHGGKTFLIRQLHNFTLVAVLLLLSIANNFSPAICTDVTDVGIFNNLFSKVSMHYFQGFFCDIGFYGTFDGIKPYIPLLQFIFLCHSRSDSLDCYCGYFLLKSFINCLGFIEYIFNFSK